MKNSNNYKNLFELDNEIIYLNCSSMSPLLKSVNLAGKKGLKKRLEPWKMTDLDWFGDAEILRNKASRIFQTSEDNIAIIPSASYGLATAAKNLNVKKGKSIIVIEDQFPSNFYVWNELSKRNNLKIITIKKPPDKPLTDSILNALNKNTGIVAVPNCHWTDGTLIDLLKLSEAVKSVNAFLVLDLSQSLGALPINIDKVDPDFAVSVGYKWLLGPYSLGYMYVSPRWHKGEPLEYNWAVRKGSENFAGLTNYNSEYRSGARKFDMGETAQFNTMQMAITALDQILKWKIEKIQSTIKSLTDIISENISPTTAFRAGHIIGVKIKKNDAASLKKRLKKNKIIVSFRGSSIRISPHLYNDVSDINSLLDCIV